MLKPQIRGAAAMIIHHAKEIQALADEKITKWDELIANVDEIQDACKRMKEAMK